MPLLKAEDASNVAVNFSQLPMFRQLGLLIGLAARQGRAPAFLYEVVELVAVASDDVEVTHLHSDRCHDFEYAAHQGGVRLMGLHAPAMARRESRGAVIFCYAIEKLRQLVF